TESPESPHIVASPISFPDSTPPVGYVEELKGSDTSGAGSTTAHMDVHVQPTMSPGCSARIAKVAAMFDVAFRDELGDEEVSLDSDSGSKDAEDEGPVIGDEDPSLDDEGYGFNDESHGIDDEGHSVERDGLGLEEEDEAVPEGQQQAAPVVETTVGEPLGLGYGALRRTICSGGPRGSIVCLRTYGAGIQEGLYEFRALWRPVLALETWAGHVDTRMANMSRAGYDNHRLVQDLLVQQTSLHHELQEMMGHVVIMPLEQREGSSESSRWYRV
ncbi:hypothetical protein Tco_0091145, partial [Tanacetum coccineum]